MTEKLEKTENLDIFVQIQALLGYKFKEISLLKQALSHASSTGDKLQSNQRLEFFGDSVLGMVVCKYLYDNLATEREGILTEVKSIVVSTEELAEAIRKMEIKQFIILGKGIAASPRLPDSVLANIFEAIVAALYIDGGLAVAQEFILKHLHPLLQAVPEKIIAGNYKSQLQEMLQQEGLPIPAYKVIKESGPDHQKIFQIAAYVENEKKGEGYGTTKKEAEKNAAAEALTNLINQKLSVDKDRSNNIVNS